MRTVAVCCLFLLAHALENDPSNIRKDAEQESYESMMIVEANGPISSLFSNCLKASRTIAAKLFFIEMPGTTDGFIRHVPDSYELTAPVEWKNVTWTPPVSSILECAAAVYEMDKPMFKYYGGDNCQVAYRMYDWQYESSCETEMHEAVFIQDSWSAGCDLPGWMLNINTTAATSTCTHVSTDLMSYDEAIKWCKNRGATIFVQTPTLKYSLIVQLLVELAAKGLNGNVSNFFTAAVAETSGVWYWKTSSSKEAVNVSLYTSYTYSAGDALYMKGSVNFKLDYAPKSSFKAGVVCAAEDWSMHSLDWDKDWGTYRTGA